jgi:hypothetical protein
MSLNLRCPRLHGVFDLRSKSEFYLSRVSSHQIHCSAASYEVSPRHLSHAPSHFAASVHLIFLITGPVIHAVEQRLTRRYDLIVADDWRFGNVNERVEEEMMTQNSVAGANEVASISLESLRHTSSNPAILGVCSATWAP